jgi:hypothetical protein
MYGEPRDQRLSRRALLAGGVALGLTAATAESALLPNWALSNSQRCPAGGGHTWISPEVQPWQFLVPHDIGQPPWTQDQWRFCVKCSAMFFDGYGYKGQYGFCPYDYASGHAAAGYDFAIPVSSYNT